jgi:hypothetical protein
LDQREKNEEKAAENEDKAAENEDKAAENCILKSCAICFAQQIFIN